MVTIHLDLPLFIQNYHLKGNLDLPSKGVVLITGENGVGKSTLCHYLFEEKILPQKVVWTESNQFRSIYPITVHSILALYKENGTDIDLERYQLLYSLFKMSIWSERIWSELSSGQGQMLKLLMGLSLNAETYLLDEPAHFLDQEKLRALSDVITSISKESLVIIIDHRIDWFDGKMDKHYQLQAKDQTIMVEQI